MSVKDQFETVLDTKKKMRSAITATGVEMSEDTPFSKYPDFIRKIPVTTFDTASVKHQNFNMKTTYYNADTAQVWTGGTVNFGGNLYDLNPSMIVDGKTILGVTGETATIADNDYYILDEDFAVHRDRIAYIRNKSGIFNSSKYNSDYYEGLFIFEWSDCDAYVFCLRNFDITECSGELSHIWFKYKGAITILYYKEDDRYEASYDIDNEYSIRRNTRSIVYSSRYLYYGYFDSGHPYMPMQIYPKPFEVTLNLKDYLLPETTKLRFKYRGNGMLARMCIKYTDDNYCFNWEGQNASNEWHRCSIGLDEIQDLIDKDEVKLIIVGHITGLQNVNDEATDDGGYTQGIFTLTTKAEVPLPHEMINCSYLFKNSHIKIVSNDIMSYCCNTVRYATDMFLGCTDLTSSIDHLFDKCTNLIS